MSLWDTRTPTEIITAMNELLAASLPQAPPDYMLLPYRQYRWLVRGRIVNMLSRRKRNNRPKFANAMRHS